MARNNNNCTRSRHHHQPPPPPPAANKTDVNVWRSAFVVACVACIAACAKLPAGWELYLGCAWSEIQSCLPLSLCLSLCLSLFSQITKERYCFGQTTTGCKKTLTKHTPLASCCVASRCRDWTVPCREEGHRGVRNTPKLESASSQCALAYIGPRLRLRADRRRAPAYARARARACVACRGLWDARATRSAQHARASGAHTVSSHNLKLKHNNTMRVSNPTSKDIELRAKP